MLYYLYVFVAAVLIALALGATVLWLNRRSEMAALWIAATGAVAAVLALLQVFDPLQLSTFAIPLHASGLVLQLFGLSGYSLHSFGLQPKRRILLSAAGVTALALLAIWTTASLPAHATVAVGAVAVAAVLLAALAVMTLLKSPGGATTALAVGMVVAAVAAVWDQSAIGLVQGLATVKATPFVLLALLSCLSFLAIRAFMNRLSDQEKLTQQLGDRIEKTKANLLASESARRSLEVSSAITNERERMMREIHDGIGSSLMAAIASAERQGRQTSTAIVALKSALTDLRIAVDSLEPVEGNVATLLASLRYRLEPEMRRLGISIDWRVGDVPELEWLDAPNALHVLRIFQEAIGNILGHANANMIRFECRLDLHEGRPGIRIEVEDNGVGFDTSIPSQGKGRRNIAERAEALEGKLWVESAPGVGTKTSLWLPLLRSGVRGAAS